MKASVAWIAVPLLALSLSPSVAVGKTLCIQNNTTGDAFVIKKIGRGSKRVSAYLAKYGGGDFDFVPLSGSSILSSSDVFVAGLTEYGTSLTTDGTSSGFVEETTFHRIQCYPGSDGKLKVGDTCGDTAWRLPANVQSGYPGIVVDCVPEYVIP
jgi:hypothetical protein